MKKLLIIALIIVAPRLAFSIAQSPDLIIIDGKQQVLYANPLFSRSDFQDIRKKMFASRGPIGGSDCAWGFVVEWTVLQDELYLTKILPCYSWDTIKFDLNRIFGAECKNGSVKATWVSGDLHVPAGHCLFYERASFSSVYEKEKVLKFENGKLVSTKSYENKVARSPYSEDLKKLRDYIYENIDWSKVPRLDADTSISVSLSIVSCNVPKPDSVRVTESYRTCFEKGVAARRIKVQIPGSYPGRQTFEAEVVRVVSQLPDWDVFVRAGQTLRRTRTCYFTFSKEVRQEYAGQK